MKALHTVFCVLYLAILHSITMAQPATGTIRGRVISGESGVYLEGALVTVKGTPAPVYTDRQGEFLLLNVAVGERLVSVSYTGLESRNATVSVPANDSARVEIVLSPSVYQMANYEITAVREGNALAITQQRAADNVKHIVSPDAAGNMAEGNVADLLQRLPGIVVNYSAADPAEVSIRGVSAELTSVTMDGANIAGAASTTARTFAFTVLTNYQLLESVEITKAATPEMDAAAIGGSVNLRTKNPFRSKVQQRLELQLGGNIETISSLSARLQPTMSGSFMKIFGSKRKVGLTLSGNYTPYFHVQDQVSVAFQPTLATPAYLTSFGFVDGPKITYRYSGGVRLDYELSEDSTAFINTNFGYARAELNNRVFTLSTRAEVANLVNGQFVGRGTVLPNYTEQITEARATPDSTVTFGGNNNWVTSASYLVQSGARHKFDTLEIDYNASFSTAHREQDRNGGRGNISASLKGVGWRVDRTRSVHFPQWDVTEGPDYMNLDNYSDLRYTQGLSVNNDEIWGAQLDVKKTLSSRFPVQLKSGLRYNNQRRDFNSAVAVYTYVGADGVIGMNPATGRNDDRLGRFAEADYRRDPTVGGYRSPNWISVNEVGSYFPAHTAEFRRELYTETRDTLRANREAEEGIAAGYVQGRIVFGPLSVLTGVRTERTDVSGEGAIQGPLLNTIVDPKTGATRKETVTEANQRISGETSAQRTARLAAETARRSADPAGAAVEEWGARRAAKGSYQQYFPSVHCRYEPLRNLILRASWSTGIGRPNFTNLMPNDTVNYTSETVTASNPNLKPQLADSYDLAAEYYFEPVGALTAAWFRKDIRDFIFSSSGGIIPTGPNNGFNGLYEGFNLATTLNGGSAKITGFEFAYQQQLRFLPGPLKGLGLSATYTELKTEGNYGEGQVRSTESIAGFVPRFINLGLTYPTGGHPFA